MGGWNPDAIERQLAHREQDDVRRAYLHAAEYWPERVKMMQAWPDYLDELRERGSRAAGECRLIATPERGCAAANSKVRGFLQRFLVKSDRLTRRFVRLTAKTGVRVPRGVNYFNRLWEVPSPAKVVPSKLHATM
jgi:hypothetical protein